jgi:hypothetical protein
VGLFGSLSLRDSDGTSVRLPRNLPVRGSGRSLSGSPVVCRSVPPRVAADLSMWQAKTVPETVSGMIMACRSAGWPAAGSSSTGARSPF